MPRYNVIAVLPDGVKILAPKMPPTSFTSEEIRQAILDYRAEKSRK
jgi:hypothetical protein